MGTSGSGNHFVEFGEVELLADDPQIGLPKGKYLGILSHSGSRGFGAEIAQYYVRVAAEQCPLPKEAPTVCVARPLDPLRFGVLDGYEPCRRLRICLSRRYPPAD